jgi:DNA-binding CsgD family transcriptional regulator
LATGETARRRSASGIQELTAEEALIAQLACDRLSDPEISFGLFISARTVLYHRGQVLKSSTSAPAASSTASCPRHDLVPVTASARARSTRAFHPS